ncbi:hypothetical protein ABZ330_03495 [Streptomyces sp. NPDC006172]|uniref:hypothetical protein n=1 Tax=Streptomyces sp. NPDC006172 TaxID=3154470 RepID=UPI0033CDF543
MTEPLVTSRMATVDALALLPLPAPLSDAQREGHVCVWGGEALAPGTAVDLGSRRLDGRLMFPRACRSCVSRVAMGALFDHCTGDTACKTCQATPECDTGRALNRVIRLGHR